MPKLSKALQKKVADAEVQSGFSLLDPGKYIGTLAKVESKTSANDNVYWNAEFEKVTNLDGEESPGRQWYMMMLPTSDTPPEGYKPGGKEKDPAKAWKMYQDLCASRIKGFFEAFGYTTDSDAEEMIGEQCLLTIGVETIQKGAKAGQETNRVNNVEPLDAVDGAAEVVAGKAAEKSKDDF